MTIAPARPEPARLESPRLAVRNAARGGLANLAGTAFTGLAGLGVTWLVARALTPAAAGAFFSATATFVLAVAVAKLGTQTSLVYWPARLRATGDPVGLRRCLRLGLAPVALSALAVGAALFFGADAIPGLGGDPAFVTQVRSLALFVPVAALTDAMLATTRGLRVLRPTVVLDRVARPAAQLGLLALLWSSGAAPGLFVLGWAAPLLPMALLAALWLSRQWASTVDGLRTDVADQLFTARAYWDFTAPRAVASMAQMALQRVDVLLVAAMAGLAPAALYTVAGRFVVLGQFVNQGLAQAVQPRLAERLATGDTVGANRLYRQSTAWLILSTWPMYLLLIGYAPVYLGLFGPRYQAGAAVVVVLALAMLVATGCGMVDMVLAMGGRTWWNLANVAVALTVMLAIDLVAVPRLGALGAAIGLAGAVLTNNLVPLAQVWRGLGVHPFGRATLLAGALALGCFAVPQVPLHLAGTESVPVRLAVTAAGVAAYLLGAARCRATLIQGDS